jgi:hypothetical protein
MPLLSGVETTEFHTSLNDLSVIERTVSEL